VINALIAVGYPVLIALSFGILIGNSVPGGFSFAAFLGGFIIGGLWGLIGAGIVCGVLAVLIDIRNLLAAKAICRNSREWRGQLEEIWAVYLKCGSRSGARFAPYTA
jgi:hypothetical protein